MGTYLYGITGMRAPQLDSTTPSLYAQSSLMNGRVWNAGGGASIL